MLENEINLQDHVGLVYTVAQDLANTNETCIKAFGRDVSEYIGEGFLALEKAKRGFKPELGWQFSTYASEVIRDRLIQAARRSSLIKIGVQARYEAVKVLSGKPIEQKNEKKVKAALLVMRANKTTISPEISTTKEQIFPAEIKEELNARLNKLDSRTRDVIVWRFGLDGDDPLTLEEVGDKLVPKITRERVRQIEKKGLSQLKDCFNF